MDEVSSMVGREEDRCNGEGRTRMVLGRGGGAFLSPTEGRHAHFLQKGLPSYTTKAIWPNK